MDEYFCDGPAIRGFVGVVHDAVGSGQEPGDFLSALRPAFKTLLDDPDWLPFEFRAAISGGSMGGGIASWLLYRSADRHLTLMSLVVPAGACTPIHDHLAWGLVGLYRGAQDEEVYRRLDDGGNPGTARLELVQRRHLGHGEFYELLPPEGDIHRVCTTGSQASVSIHLLGNDIGCVRRHSFEPASASVREFQSGYSNLSCEFENVV
jgi:3-mercaptopropionate dioxygenase